MERSWGASRAILHADLDCFFASVEVLDDPSLKGLPVLVGGTGPRGVVAAASYEARVFGARSAMSMPMARRLCPSAKVIAGRHHRYREVSGQFFSILESFTDEIESIGLDEAFLDVTGAQKLFGTPTQIAVELRRRVKEELSLSVCVGVAATKQVAKLASKRAKPTIAGSKIIPARGVGVVWPGSEVSFLAPLSVRELWGVGPKTEQKLKGIGVSKVFELREIPDAKLLSTLGKSGLHLKRLAEGQDDDPVSVKTGVKSISHEQTYPSDLNDPGAIATELARLAEAVTTTASKKGLLAKTLTLKLRYPDFTTITRSATFDLASSSRSQILQKLRELLPGDAPETGVRLLGVSLSNLVEPQSTQLHLEDGIKSARQEKLDRSVVAIKERFGEDSLVPAALIEKQKIKIRSAHDAPWG
jgi:DNA polymerase-4